MKTFLKYIAVCIGGIGLSSCNSYLKENSGDLLIPKNVMEYIPVLIGEGYPRSFNSDCEWFVLMTDDVEMGVFEKDPSITKPTEGFDTWGGEGRQAFKWDIDIEEKLTDNFWEKRYANILGCNTIISQLPHMEYTELQTGKYNYLAAQAYTLRAYHYFCLVNTYALPWSEANLDKLGVVLRDSPEISSVPRERETIGNIYKFINGDLEKASEYFNKAESSANKHLISPAAFKLLKTRVDLFQEKWDDVISTGEEFIKDYPSIHDLNSEVESKLGGINTSDPYIFDLSKNNEIIFTFGDASRFYSLISPYTTYAWSFGFRVSYPHDSSAPGYTDPNKPLISCYEDGDLRRLAYFEKDIFKAGWPTLGIPDEWEYHYNYPLKFRSSGSTGYHECWRTVEVFLNLAEAYARKAPDVSQDAIKLLNRLRICRIKKTMYNDLTAGDFKNKQELVEFIWTERRCELCFEEAIRWWDLRRQGMPRLEHRLLTTNTMYETYILEQGGKNYTLAIPRSETSYNGAITGNSRDNITPLK